MINYNETNINEEASAGANGPVSVDKLKEYGKKAYVPLLNVVNKYQDEFTPYLDALAKGLQGGVEALNREDSSDAEKYVSQLFKEASNGIGEACEKLKVKDVNELTNYLSNFAEKKPSLMFSTSYIAGLFFGRLARHVISRQRSHDQDLNLTSDIDTNEPPTINQSIH